MALINPTIKNAGPHGGCQVVTWVLGDADTANPADLAEFSDKTWHVYGTFGGATITAQGSNEESPGGSSWNTISNRQGSNMTFAAAGINTSQDRPRWIRPSTAGGTGSTITVQVACHRSDLGAIG